jgi:hypothetical protein
MASTKERMRRALLFFHLPQMAEINIPQKMDAAGEY